MNAKNYRIASQSLLAAGSLSIVGSLGLWLAGRLRGDAQMKQDGLFVGLWVPSFYILADRLATAALDEEERRRSVVQGSEISEEQHEANQATEPVQSPRPLQHVTSQR